MTTDTGFAQPRGRTSKTLLRTAGLALAAAAASLVGAGTASAHYIGPAFIKVPGVNGGVKQGTYKGWTRTEAHYWGKRTRTWFFGANILTFSGPMAPRQGASVVNVAVDKKTPEYKALMSACAKGDALPEVTLAENSALARNPLEAGPRPENVPVYYEYSLKNVKLSCPVAADAPEQAFTLSFDQIEWKNAEAPPKPRDLTAITQPASLFAAPTTGRNKTAVLTWFAGAVDAQVAKGEKQCVKMNAKPTQDQYYKYLSPERTEAQKAAFAKQGGVSAMAMPMRGPGELDVTMLPGIVGDPGFTSPTATVVAGLNLDGDDGKGKAPRGIRKHANFIAPWGETGIDNQLYTVEGCVEGWRRNGFLPLISNDMRASGELSILVRVSGIDDDQNDNDVVVDFLYSRDGMKRVGPAKVLLSDYTYRVSDRIDDSNAFARFHAKIINGVVVTEPIEKMSLHYSNTSAMNVYKPRMRLEFKPDGSMKGVLGGYRDWREYIAYAFLQKGQYEATIGYDSAAMYNAIRRAADGLQDPETGEYLGISAAWDLEGVAAYIPPEQQTSLAAAR